MNIFSRLLIELGLPFAPHKTRGPARVMEFLGFLLCNVAGRECIALTESRQAFSHGTSSFMRVCRPTAYPACPGGGLALPQPARRFRRRGRRPFSVSCFRYPLSCLCDGCCCVRHTLACRFVFVLHWHSVSWKCKTPSQHAMALLFFVYVTWSGCCLHKLFWGRP